jgi:hypothetical protein
MENQQVDSLAKDVVTFIHPSVLKLKYHIERRHRPSILNNFHHCKVFEGNKQIKQFLEMVDEFYETHIDQENQNDPSWVMQEGENPEKLQDKIANHHMLFLKNNQVPRGLIPLERFFGQAEIPLKSTLCPLPK